MLELESLFWACLAILFYVYFGYPIFCRLLAPIVRRWPRSAPWEPKVSILIPAYNEVDCIEQTVRNKLLLDYPPDKLEIIVISDGSDDGTDEAVARLSNSRVRLLRQQPRAGKTSALNLALPHLHGEVIVIADANSLYSPHALRHLVEPLADPEVGYVTGRMVYKAPDGSLTGEGCSSYMRFENTLRGWETPLGSIVGVDGGIDAVRRELFLPMRPEQLPDFALPLSVRQRGYRIVYASKALLYEDALQNARDEFRMRVRVALRAWHTLKEYAFMLNPWRYGLFAWQLLSHKWLRYLAAFFQLGILVSNVLLASQSPFWRVVLLLQGLFYALALVGHFWNKKRQPPRLLTLVYYLCLINMASAVAFFRFLQGRRLVMWSPRT